MANDPEIDEKTAGELLAKERERIETSLSDLKRLRRGEHQDAAEETDQSDRGERIEGDEVDHAVEHQLRSELEAVERAEQRLQEGSYGLSIVSGDPIPAERLKAIPWAERTAEEER